MGLFDNLLHRGGSAPADSDAADNARRRLVEAIKLSGFEDKFIDRDEERKLLSLAVEGGLSLEDALAVLREVARQAEYVLEREAEEQADTLLAQFAASGGAVDKKEFDQAVTFFRATVKNRRTEEQVRRRLKQIMQDRGWKAKEGGLFGSKWFSEIR